MRAKPDAMRKTLLILTPFLLILAVCACKKSNNNSNTSQGLVGTWNFLGMKVQTKTVAVAGQVTTVALSNFNTTNNLGAITFTKDSMSASGIGYTVDTSFMAYFYYGGQVYDSSLQTLNYTIQPTSASSKYSLIGTDSIYFPNGGILTALDSAATGQGCQFVLHGDSLTLTANGIDTSGGAQTNLQAVINLKRQK